MTAQSLTQGLWSLGGALGSQIGGVLGSKIGRKNSLLINNAFIITGLLLQVRDDVTFLQNLLKFFFIIFSLKNVKNIFARNFSTFQVLQINFKVFLVLDDSTR